MRLYEIPPSANRQIILIGRNRMRCIGDTAYAVVIDRHLNAGTYGYPVFWFGDHWSATNGNRLYIPSDREITLIDQCEEVTT